MALVNGPGNGPYNMRAGWPLPPPTDYGSRHRICSTSILDLLASGTMRNELLLFLSCPAIGRGRLCFGFLMRVATAQVQDLMLPPRSRGLTGLPDLGHSRLGPQWWPSSPLGLSDMRVKGPGKTLLLSKRTECQLSSQGAAPHTGGRRQGQQAAGQVRNFQKWARKEN